MRKTTVTPAGHKSLLQAHKDNRVSTITTYDTKFSTKKLILICLAFTCLLCAAVAYWASLWSYNIVQHTAKERLGLYSGIFSAALDRHKYLPYVVAEDDRTIKLVSTWKAYKRGKAKLQEVTILKFLANTYLQKLQKESQAASIYIMDEKGNVLSSDNWDQEKSIVGKKYETTPYFLDAIYGVKGRYFAIQYTSGKPEYFLSAPIYVKGSIIGVAATKADLKPLQDQWLKGSENVIVTDEYGVAVLASNKNWIYGTLDQLPKDSLEEFQKRRRYKGRNLRPLTPTNLKAPGVTSLIIGERKYFFNTKVLNDRGWKIYYLTPEDTAIQRIWVSTLIAAICGILILLLVLLRRQRRIQQRNKERLEAAERMKAINKKLRQEVKEREKAEKELQEIQEELIQNGKLSALGHMAAAMAHEINQPITGLKMSMFNARKLLMSQRSVEEILPILSEMESLADRMRRITEQLKAFARKEPLKLKRFDARDVVQESLKLIKHQLKTNDCELVLELGEEPLTVEADSGRLEQVLVNLSHNAIDAMQSSEVKTLTISAEIEQTNICIYVRDTGSGIPESEISHIFEPFYTTKSAGKGIGLGLAISRRIIEHFDGELNIINIKGQGACFKISLPVPDAVEAKQAVAI